VLSASLPLNSQFHSLQYYATVSSSFSPSSDVQIEQIFISLEHNFVGHYGQPPGTSPLIKRERIECVAGKGLRGDRYFNHAEDYKGQITFFSAEVFERLCAHFGLREKPAGVLRRNVIVSGVDLLSLIGCDFEIQGVKFRGTQHCAPCEWMDVAFAPGAKEFLKENAGLRAKILTNGELHLGDAQLRILTETKAATANA
jgi:MOSC domain-containing protein YiiM